MRRTLTEPQQIVLDFLTSKPPVGQSQRELARDIGLPSHQALAVAMLGLYMKGYLVVDPAFTKEQEEARQ